MCTLGQKESRFQHRCHLFRGVSGAGFDVPGGERCGRQLTSKANAWPAFLRDAPWGRTRVPEGWVCMLKATPVFQNPTEDLPAWSLLRTEIGSALEETQLSPGSRKDIFTTTRGFIHNIFKLEAT